MAQLKSISEQLRDIAADIYLLEQNPPPPPSITTTHPDYGARSRSEAWIAVHTELTRHNSYSRAVAAPLSGIECALATIRYLQERSDILDDIENLL